MKAAVFHKYGDPDVLRLEDVERPTPRDSEVLVHVHAASVNDWDWGLIRGETTNRIFNGLLTPKRTIPGCDVAGVVEAVGSSVSSLAPGDTVYGDLCVSGFGAFAEYVCAPAASLCRKPDGMTFEQAAAVPQAAMLAVQGLIDVGQVDAGKQRVLLNGAGGGVGTFALQLLRAWDVQVTCVDRSDKLEALLTLGADQVIDYELEDFTRSEEQYDLILDPKTNRSPFAYLDALTPGGVYATVGGLNPRLAQTFLLGRYIKRRYGKELRIVALKPNKDLAFMNREFEAGRVVPVIDSVYELADAAEAMRRLVAADQIGKVIIRMDGG